MGLGFLMMEFLQLEPSPLEAFVIGWGVLIGTLELYHLFRPVELAVSLAVVAAGLVGLTRKLFRLREFGTELRSINVAAAAFSLLLIFVIALRSTGPCVHYDTGLYGVSAVQWLTSFRVVPGIANLYGRLGFNSSFFLCIAALQSIGLGPLSYRLWEGALLALTAVLVVVSIAGICRGSQIRPSAWFNVILIVPLVSYIGYSQLVGVDTDLPSTLCCFLGVFLLLREWENREGTVAARQATLIAACVVFAMAIVTKLSTAAFAGPCCLLSLWKLSSVHAAPQASRRARAGCFFLLAEIFALWVCAGYVESGYPLYPNDLLGLPFSWKVPDASVRMLAGIIKSWARVAFVSRHKTEGWRWLTVWLLYAREDRIHFWAPLVTIGVAVVLLVLVSNKSGYSLRDLWPVLLFGLLSAVVWFFMAPDLRFVQGPIWALAGIIGGISLTSLNARIRPQFALLVVLVILFFSVFLRVPQGPVAAIERADADSVSRSTVPFGTGRHVPNAFRTTGASSDGQRSVLGCTAPLYAIFQSESPAAPPAVVAIGISIRGFCRVPMDAFSLIVRYRANPRTFLSLRLTT